MIVNSKNRNYGEVNKKIDNVNGWYFRSDMCAFDFLLTLQENLKINGNLVEIGIWEGKSLFKILDYCKNNEILYGIDYELKLDKIQEQYKNFNNVNHLKLIEDTSLNIKNHHEINNVRFCHIDGCHKGIIAYNDIINTSFYTNDAAILVLDDFAKDYISIMQAYYKAHFMGQTEFIPILYTNRKCYLCKKNFYNIYYTQIKNNIVNFFNNYNDKHNIKHIIEHTETNVSDVLELSEYQHFEDLSVHNKNSIGVLN